MVYPYNGILSDNKKEWSTDAGSKMNEPQKHYAKKPVTKDYKLYFSFIWQVNSKQIYRK